MTEAVAAADYFKGRREQISQSNELTYHLEREAAERMLHQRQAVLSRRPRLQPAILAAARHYRDRAMSARQAWDALNKTPFPTDDGHVEIEGRKLPRLKQRMRVRQADGRQRKRAISFEQWRKSYWKGAKIVAPRNSMRQLNQRY